MRIRTRLRLNLLLSLTSSTLGIALIIAIGLYLSALNQRQTQAFRISEDVASLTMLTQELDNKVNRQRVHTQLHQIHKRIDSVLKTLMEQGVQQNPRIQDLLARHDRFHGLLDRYLSLDLVLKPRLPKQQKRLQQQLVISTHAFSTAAIRLNRFYTAELQRVALIALPAAIAVLFAVILALFWLGLSLSRTIWGSTQRLQTGISQLLEGNLAYRIGTLPNDELGDLGRAFDHMVTRLQKVQGMVEESEAKFRSISSAAQDGVILINAKGLVVYWNDAATRILGHEAKQVLGRNGHNILAPARYLEAHRKAFATFTTSGEGPVIGQVLELNALHKDGHEIPVELSISKLQLDGQWHALGILRDISERKAAEQAMKESELRFRELFNNMSSGVAICEVVHGGEDFIIRDLNQAALLSSKLERESVIGKRLLEVFPSMEAMGLIEVFRRVCQSGIPQRHPATLYQDDRITQWVDHYIYLLPSGELVAIYDDITEQKIAEEALRISNQELQEFVYIASHDLKEPLRKVQAFGDRLQEKYHEQLGDQGKDYLGRMTNAAKRMQTLIDDLLTYSRVTTKAQPFKRVDLGLIMHGVLSDLETAIEEAGAELVIGDLPVVEGDPVQMRQLLQNLLGNALKFCQPGRIPKIEIGLQQITERGFYEIAVSDNGIGFDPKYEERIFKVFERLHGRNEYSGTGIGLAICHKIVSRHGGTIRAQGVPGQGATFYVTIPMQQDNQEQ